MRERGCLIYTLGDPHSINVEAFLRLFKEVEPKQPVVVIGSRWQFDHQAKMLGLAAPKFSSLEKIEDATKSQYYFLDSSPYIGCKPPETLSESERGAMMVDALRKVPKQCARPLAVLTGPIDKYAANLAGFTFPGQTEFFEDLWQDPAVMLLAGAKLRVAIATNHLALKNVAAEITQNRIEKKIAILAAGLRDLFGIAKPRIAVCGLNPHCGDQGLFGHEDEQIIKPAVAQSSERNSFAEISGPMPADTIFYRAVKGQFDAVLAMYHDQGLGPLKTVHFDDAVNISLGLKHLRVSPDHGPARDLYGKGTASWQSFAAAKQLCERYTRGEQS